MLNSKEMESQLSTIPLHYVHFIFQPVEYGKGVANGIGGYGYLRNIQPHLIPTEKQFVDEFLRRTINLFPIGKLMTEYDKYKMGLECRAKRAYRAMVREEHATVRMTEIYKDYNIEVFYDEEDDWKKGIDATLIDYETKRIHFVHMFKDSPAAWEARKHKEKRGQGRDFSTHVDLPFRWQEGKKVGQFYLYSDSQLLGFLDKLRSEYLDKGVELNDQNLSLHCHSQRSA
jgi:hypothetical protein